MDITLHTPRLTLRPIVAGDLEDLLELDSDPEVMRYISGGAPSTPADYEELLPRMLAHQDEPIGYFAAVDRRSSAPPHQRFLGWFHLRPSVVDPEVLELGYRLKRRVWGIGFATEGSLALLRRAFFELDQLAVDACALPENAASQAVLVKCGMREVGSFVHPRLATPCVRYLVDESTFKREHGHS